jgi:molecular chaperone DnaK
MEAKTAGLTDVLHRMSEQIYQRAAQAQGGPTGAGADGDGTEEQVEDAEYEVIDEDAPKSA